MYNLIFAPFIESKKYDGLHYSLSRFQPKGFAYEELLSFAPVEQHYQEIRTKRIAQSVSEIKDPVNKQIVVETIYRERLRAAYKSRWSEIMGIVKSIDVNNQNVIMSCWCPHTQTARESLERSGYFICHSGLVALIFEKYRPDLNIVMDSAYDKLHSDWKPKQKQKDLYMELM